jgi:hypothetical protein
MAREPLVYLFNREKHEKRLPMSNHGGCLGTHGEVFPKEMPYEGGGGDWT